MLDISKLADTLCEILLGGASPLGGALSWVGRFYIEVLNSHLRQLRET